MLPLLDLIELFPSAASTQDPKSDVRQVPAPSDDELEAGRQRALGYLQALKLEDRCAADGRRVGIQSTLSTSASGDFPLDLYTVLDGMVAEPALSDAAFANDPLRAFWQAALGEIQKRLGFPLEPELFSNMLVVAFTGHLESEELGAIQAALLDTFRRTDVHGLYHFFTSLRFACDTDCTGMALRARLAVGDLDLTDSSDIEEFRRSTERLLGSASVANVTEEQNASYGKSHGALLRHVFKVYLDDHLVQGALLDRGLKNNPIVSVNALLPILVEISLGLRDMEERIVLLEYPGRDQPPRRGEASVAEIVATNLAYTAAHLITGQWRQGCRYYGSPDAFLGFYTELVGLFPEIDELFGVRGILIDALYEQRPACPGEIGDTSSPLNIALRAISLQNLGMPSGAEQRALLNEQGPEGGFPRYSPLYGLGTKERSIFFGSSELTTFLAYRALSTDGGIRLPRGPHFPTQALKARIWKSAVETST